VIGDVRRVLYDDSGEDGADEAWERDIEVDDGEVRYVQAAHIDFEDGWHVTVPLMEFVREGPLEGELRRQITAALRTAEGVEAADEMDREVWFVTGTPSGVALVRAVGEVLDSLAQQSWAHIRS
jgi:hypothetical protein